MKEATGEMNVTVFVVTVVAILVAFFYTIIWPMIKNNMASTTKCSDAICEKNPDSDGMVDCYYMNKDKTKSEPFKCVWKG